MNSPSKFALYLAVAGAAPAASFAQSADHYVAQVSRVAGTCRECPHGHPEQSRRISVGTRLAADDDIQCDSKGWVVATYTGSNTYFRMEGAAWQPVGFPGTDRNSDPQQPREGRIAYNTLDDAASSAQTSSAQTSSATTWGAMLGGLSGRTKATKQHDSDLSQTVRVALDKNDVDVKNIRVEAKEGKVVLRGEAVDEAQLKKAQDVAKNVDGVTSVDNELHVIVVEAEGDGRVPAAAPTAAAQGATAAQGAADAQGAAAATGLQNAVKSLKGAAGAASP